MSIGGCSLEPRAPDICPWDAAREARANVVPIAAGSTCRRAVAARPAVCGALLSAVPSVLFGRGRRRDRRRAQGGLWRRGRTLRACRRQRRAFAAGPLPSLRPMSALPDFWSGGGVVPPDAPALPQRLNDGRHTIGAAPDFGAFPTCPTRTNLARAPPLSVCVRGPLAWTRLLSCRVRRPDLPRNPRDRRSRRH
jgi:hypothetical protein